MILKDAQHIYSFSTETDLALNLQGFSKDIDVHDAQSILLVLQYLQEAKLIRSVDRNFARYIYQAYLDQQNEMKQADLDGIVLLIVALLSKHVGNGCLLYTSDAADDLTRVEIGGRGSIKKKKKNR